MARRAMSRQEEEALVREAERLRDADTEPSGLRFSPNATAVLSVRLPMNDLRTLRSIAKARRISLSALLQEAVEQLLATDGPKVSVSQSAIRFAVSGAELTASPQDSSHVLLNEPEQTATGVL